MLDKKSLCRRTEALGEERLGWVIETQERKKDSNKQTKKQMVCASARVWPLPGGLLSSQQEAECSFSGCIPTNKQTNKQKQERKRVVNGHVK